MKPITFSAILLNLCTIAFASAGISTTTPTTTQIMTPEETSSIISSGTLPVTSTVTLTNVSTPISTEALTTISITTSTIPTTTISTVSSEVPSPTISVATPTIISISAPPIVPTETSTVTPTSASIAASTIPISTVEVDKYDSMTNYSALISTVVVYLDKCSKLKLNQYEWRVWEGNYSIRSYVQPIATIIVKRAVDELFTMDPTTFIARAVESSAKIGGNIVCTITFKKNPYTFGIESMTFRSYRQVFLSGNKSWEDFYNERITKELPITNQQIRSEFIK